MAYDGTKLNLIAQGPGDSPSLFDYTHSDARATVEGAGYFSDGRDRGMKLGDKVIVCFTTGYLTTIHAVSAVNATTGACTINAAVLA